MNNEIRHTLLVIDDEPDILSSLSRLEDFIDQADQAMYQAKQENKI